MFHLFYKITNLLNGKYYYGIHSTDNLDDGYMGSSKDLWNDIKIFGIQNFLKEEVEFLESRELLRLREKEIVNEEKVKDLLCYNKQRGGASCDNIGYSTYITKEGKHLFLHKKDSLVISKEVKSLSSGENNNMYGSKRYGKKNPFFGKTHTKEIKKIFKEKNTGENNPMFGKKHSNETKEKQKQKAIGRIILITSKQKIRETLINKTLNKYSEEEKEYIIELKNLKTPTYKIPTVFIKKFNKKIGTCAIQTIINLHDKCRKF